MEEVDLLNEENDNEPFDEDAFGIGVYTLMRKFQNFSSASGAAAQALLRECTQILDRLAWSLEVAEADYSSARGRTPYIDQRGDHLIGSLLSILTETDDSPEEAIVAMLLSSDVDAQTVACRALMAAAPSFRTDKATPPIFQILREEAAFERLTTWVGADASSSGEASNNRNGGGTAGPLLVFATGLLAVLVLGRDIADYVVRTPIPAAILRCLREAPLVPDPATSPAVPPSLHGITAVELTRRGIQYSLICLTPMSEYQEILTPFFQEEGLEVVLRSLARPDLGCRLAAVEMTARLLAHKKFAMAFVQAEGVDRLMELSQDEQAFQLHAALALCMFGLASLANVMEEVCRLPASTFDRLVQYAISLLSCPQEAAQKSIVLFFGLALSFRPVLQAFDAEDDIAKGGGGLYRLLNLLRTGGTMGGGGPSAFTPTPQRRGQLAHYTTLCLRHHLRVHLALYAASLDAEAPLPPGTKRPRLNSQDLTASSAVPSSHYRPIEVDDGVAESLLNRVRSGALSLPSDWAPVRRLLHHRGILVLLGVIASQSAGRAGATETAKLALDCLEMATLIPSAIHEACLEPALEQMTGMQILLEAASGLAQRDADVMRGALRVLCNCLCPRAKPSSTADSTGAAAATGGGGAGGGGTTPSGAGSNYHHQDHHPVAAEIAEEKIKRSARKDLRAKDGIKVLVSLLRYRRCIQAADEIRMLAARALLGLAQEQAIAQILEKMRLSLLLSEVVRAGPVLERARSEHYSILRTSAMQLIARITGRPASAVSHSDAMDPASWKLEKVAIVTRTPITYDPSDLLHLIRDHLQSQGLHQAARVLETEANLAANVSTPTNASSITSMNAFDASAFPPTVPLAGNENNKGGGAEGGLSGGGSLLSPPLSMRNSSSNQSMLPPPLQQAFQPPQHAVPPAICTTTAPSKGSGSTSSTVTNQQPSTLISPPPNKPSSLKRPLPENSLFSPQATTSSRTLQFINPLSHHQPTASSTTIAPLTVRRASSTGGPSSSLLHSSGGKATTRLFPAGVSLRRGASPHAAAITNPSPSLLDLPSPFPTLRLPPPHPPTSSSSTSTILDQIVVQYLRRQHEACPNPICALPPFSLTLPHRCPEPPLLGASTNISRRLMQRQVLPPFGGYKGRKLTRSLIFSRFRPWRSYRDETGRSLTCSAFPKGHPGKLWAGTDDGCVRLYNLWSSEVERSWDCHSLRVSSMSTSPYSYRQVLLTCAHEMEMGEMQAETCLWGGDDLNTPLLRLLSLRAAVFDHGGTRLAGLLPDNNAQIYDAEIGTLIQPLQLYPEGSPPPTFSKSINICFSPVDGEAVLCDGALWDLRGPQVIHRFDRLSNGGNYGAFHPNGNDVLIDGTVWDLRTHSLRTMMTGVEQCAFRFSASGDVIYAYRPGGPEAEEFLRPKRSRELTSFQVLDAADYHTIHMQETERQILDLAVDDADLYLSVVEGSSTPVGPFLTDDGICRLYEVGRRRPDDADSDIDDAHESEEDDDWEGDEDEESDIDLDIALAEGQDEEDEDEEDEEEDQEEGEESEVLLGNAEVEEEEGDDEGEEGGREGEETDEGDDEEEEEDDDEERAGLEAFLLNAIGGGSGGSSDDEDYDEEDDDEEGGDESDDEDDEEEDDYFPGPR